MTYKSSVKKRILGCGVSLAALLLATNAAAQTVASQTPTPITEDEEANSDIVVTAQKRSERLSDVPLSITAASQQQLASAGITDTSQLGKIVPGFTYQQSQFGTPVYGIRGISFFDTSGTAQPAVSVYVDQIPLPLSLLARGAALDVERVEVLKGPQGTLFGQNATGGAINYIAAKPTSQLAAGADITYGRFDQIEVGGFVSAPLGETLGVRVSARTEHRGDWQYSTTRQDGAGRRDFNVGRILLDWKPSPDVRFELNINGWRDKSDTQAGQFVAFVPLLPPPVAYPPAIAALSAYGPRPSNARGADWDQGFSLRRDDSFYQFSLSGDIDVSDTVTLTSLSSYIRFKSDAPADPDGTNYKDITNTQRDDVETFNQELRGAINLASLKLLLGANYEHARLNESGASIINGTNSLILGIKNTGTVADNFQTTDTYAAFGGVDYELTDQLTLQGALRYTKQDRAFRGCARDDGGNTFAASFSLLSTIFSGSPTTIAPGACFTLDPATFKPSGVVHRSLDQANLSWRGGLDWKPSRDVLVYGNVTRGYKAGGFSTLPTAFTTQIVPVTQESVLAYEIGTKVNLAQGRIQLTAAAFHYDYTNKQIAGYVVVQPFGNLPSLVNVPKSRVNGAEVNLTWQPDRSVRLSVSGNYTGTRVIRSFITTNPFGLPIDIRGQALPATPRWQAMVDGEYRFADSAAWQPFAGFTLNYQTASYAAFGESASFRLPQRTLLDLRLGVARGDNLRIEAFGRNVTDQYYWIHVARQIDTVSRFAGVPATYGVRATYRY